MTQNKFMEKSSLVEWEKNFPFVIQIYEILPLAEFPSKNSSAEEFPSKIKIKKKLS